MAIRFVSYAATMVIAVAIATAVGTAQQQLITKLFGQISAALPHL